VVHRANDREVADLPENEVTAYGASTSNALEAHSEEVSHEPCCHRSRGTGIKVCIRTADGTIVEERKLPTRKLEKLVAEWAPSRVILETCAEAFRIADAVIAAGHEVRVVPATLVRTLGVGSRGVKNDEKDARVLSEVSCRIDLPSVHVPSAMARHLKSMCGSREALVEARTKLINNARGWLRTQLWRVRTGATSTFPDRVRAHAVANRLELPEHLERELQVIEMIIVQVHAADRQLRQLAREHPVCKRLMTVPESDR